MTSRTGEISGTKEMTKLRSEGRSGTGYSARRMSPTGLCCEPLRFGDMFLCAYAKRLRSNFHKTKTRWLNHGSLCRSVNKRAHRQRPQFGM
jgi:hypothetical protein